MWNPNRLALESALQKWRSVIKRVLEQICSTSPFYRWENWALLRKAKSLVPDYTASKWCTQDFSAWVPTSYRDAKFLLPQLFRFQLDSRDWVLNHNGKLAIIMGHLPSANHFASIHSFIQQIFIENLMGSVLFDRCGGTEVDRKD